jgi:inhibitor of cysteine peptidase
MVAPMLLLTEADNGRTAEMRAGDTVRISLPENASTGYRWAIDHVDGGAVEATGSEPQYSSTAVGSGGRAVFTFAAKQAGNSELVLKNWRHFEGDASVQERYRVRIKVA